MKKSRKIVIAVLILIIAGCVGYVFWYISSQKDRGEVYEELQNTVVADTPDIVVDEPESKVEIPIDFAALQEKNPDIYAWIQIEGTNINYPVAQSASDNQYYLDHTIEGQAGLPGSIYTENWNTKVFTDYNTVIYGHDMRDGSMFQNLHNYTDETYMDEHRTVVIYTPEKKFTYQIFASVVYDDRHILHSFNFAYPEERQAFLDSLAESRSMGNIIKDDVEVTPDSRLLTLSTCMTGQDNKRFIVEAVLISEEQ